MKKSAERRIQNALDVKTLLKQVTIVRALLKVLLTEDEQKLIHMQKYSRVIEVFAQTESESDVQDMRNNDWFIAKEENYGPLLLNSNRYETQLLASGVFGKIQSLQMRHLADLYTSENQTVISNLNKSNETALPLV